MAEQKGIGTSCTIEELMNILTHNTGGMFMLPNKSLSLVYQGIYIGDIDAARNRPLLQQLGITHVLNAAKGRSNYHANIHPCVYNNVGIRHLAMEATDMVSYPLTMHFEEAGEFIHDALSNGGKVLVHCVEGVSRSATLVLAYLMRYKRLTAQQAMREVREGREICPNDGFLQQLCDLNDKLIKAGHFNTTEPESESE